MRPPNPTPPKNRIRELRYRLHISQATLAERVGLTSSAVSRHENRDRAITDDQALAYARALDVKSIW